MIRIANQVEILSYFTAAYSQRQHRYLGLYNSHFGKIITDQQFMLLPVDDRTATRAHGVFDVLYLKKKRIINMEQHIDRLYNSAKSVNIVPPFDKERAKEVLVDVVEQIVDHHLRKDQTNKTKNLIVQDSLGIRMTISSGFGDLSVASLNKQAVLYILVFEPYISYEKEKKGVNEFVTKIVKQPKALVHAKTIDYIENAIMANQSKSKGGYQGIKALENGVLLEAASANIAFVFGKQFATPRFETVIEGTTIKKSLAFINQLKQEGKIDTISFRDITIEQAYKADEMIVLGGDKIVPVLSFNGKPISPECGPITSALQNWYELTNEQGTAIKIANELL